MFQSHATCGSCAPSVSPRGNDRRDRHRRHPWRVRQAAPVLATTPTSYCPGPIGKIGKVDTAQDYHDIKSIIDIENPDVKYIPWILGAVTLISLALFIYFINQRPTAIGQPFGAEPPVLRISPFDEALASLDQLKKMLREDPSSVKKYYSGMNDTLRIFMNRRLGLVTMEKTSEELILSLSDLNLDKELFSKLAAALRMGDFVKFAKYIPGPYENENSLEVIRRAIVIINENEK